MFFLSQSDVPLFGRFICRACITAISHCSFKVNIAVQIHKHTPCTPNSIFFKGVMVTSAHLTSKRETENLNLVTYKLVGKFLVPATINKMQQQYNRRVALIYMIQRQV